MLPYESLETSTGSSNSLRSTIQSTSFRTSRIIDRNPPVSAELDAHLVADNYATHKHPRVKAWLARHPRFHLHYTPTYASWLNQVERWFALISHRAIRCGSFHSVCDLVQKIDGFVAHYNTHKRPFLNPHASITAGPFGISSG